MAAERLISDMRELEDLASHWPAGPLALDTEFVRERTYYAQLCLVQVATGDRLMLVDPLALPGLEPLIGLLADRQRSKLLHAARQDLEVLLPLAGAVPTPLFDTQVAAAMLGFPSQVGYGDLVKEVLGIELPKGHARTDWARRPLSAEQMTYAANDVLHLPALARVLQARLEDAGRSHWVSEDLAAMADPALYSVIPAEAWKRLKGLERMTARELGRVQALAAWREQRAMDRDLPRGWVLADPAILELARQAPRKPADFAALASVPDKTAARFGRELIEVIAAAPAAEEAPPPGGGRPTPEESRVFKRLQQALAAIATELGLQPEVLATRRDLAALQRHDESASVLHGWRREVVGEPLRAAL